MLSFLHNPVTSKPNYRLFVIHKFPQLRVLDFRKVKQKERSVFESHFKSNTRMKYLLAFFSETSANNCSSLKRAKTS